MPVLAVQVQPHRAKLKMVASVILVVVLVVVEAILMRNNIQKMIWMSITVLKMDIIIATITETSITVVIIIMINYLMIIIRTPY